MIRNLLTGTAIRSDACPVWSGSVRAEVKFNPVPKKKMIALWHRARDWDRKTRQPRHPGGRCHEGVIGKAGLAVLQTLVFDFLNYRTGRLDPSYEGIAKKAGVSRATVARALVRLRQLGVLDWVRRCAGEMCDGRYVLKQERNAYAILAETTWRGYRAPMTMPAYPEPGTWGDHPSMPTALTQAAIDQQQGFSRGSIINSLKADPSDPLAIALAGLGRALMDRKNEGLPGVSR